MITREDLKVGQLWECTHHPHYNFKINDIGGNTMDIYWTVEPEPVSNYIIDEILMVFLNRYEYTCTVPKSLNFTSLYEKLSGN